MRNQTEFDQLIYQASKDWPDSMPLDRRIRKVDKLRPHLMGASPYEVKCWQKARRTYLQRFGYEKPHIRKIKTPLERAIEVK